MRRDAPQCNTWLGLLVLFLGLLAACSAHPPQEVQHRTKLRVGYIPIAECAHLYVGLKNKYFEHEGIELDLQPMNGGAAILPALQNGDLDIGFSNVASLIVLDAGLADRAPNSFVSLVGASYERPGYSNHALLIKKGSNLTVASLGKPGTRFALNTVRNIEELMLRRYLAAKQIHAPHLNIVPIGFPEMLPALDRGNVDVVSEVEPFIEPALRSGRYSLLARQYLDVSPETIVATYAVTRQWYEKNRAIVRQFVRAFHKADEFIRSNDAETRQIIGSFTRIRTEDLSIIGMPAFEARAKKESLQDLVREMQKYGFIDRQIEVRNLVIEDD